MSINLQIVFLLAFLSKPSIASSVDPIDFIIFNYGGDSPAGEKAAKVEVDFILSIDDGKYLSCLIRTDSFISELRIYQSLGKELHRAAIAVGEITNESNIDLVSESRSYSSSLYTLSLFAKVPIPNSGSYFVGIANGNLTGLGSHIENIFDLTPAIKSTGKVVHDSLSCSLQKREAM